MTTKYWIPPFHPSSTASNHSPAAPVYKVTPVEVERETAHSFWVNGRMFRKNSMRGTLLDSRDMAYAWAHQRRERHVSEPLERIAKLQSQIEILREQSERARHVIEDSPKTDEEITDTKAFIY